MNQRTSKLLIERVQDGITVISFLENSILDASQINDISAELGSLVDDKSARLLIVDFEQVRFLCSQALGMLISLQKKLDGLGGKLRIAAMRSELHQVFKITKLDRLFQFHATVAEALQSLAGAV